MIPSNKKKLSVSGQPDAAALVTIDGSELDFFTNKKHLAYELPQFAAAQRKGKLGSDDIDDDLSEEEETEEEEEGDEGEEGDEDEDKEESEERKKNTPNLSDIEVISNEVIYDASGNPTAKIVFKIKNSSGVDIKAVNVRVEKK
jgi:hypothetical protein